MAIIKTGKPFKAKFKDNVETRVDVMLGGLPVLYSQLAPLAHISPKDSYRLALGLTEEQYNEVIETLTPVLTELGVENGIALKKTQLEALLGRAIGPSKLEPGTFRFYGSKRMGFTSRDTGETIPFNMPVHNGSIADENVIENPILGKGSIIRSSFTMSLFTKDKDVYLKIEPSVVVVLELKELPKREAGAHNVSWEGLEDNYSF